jgi:hypothetical protein
MRMATIDRADMIELLGRLGSDNDQTVLEAARELNRKLVEAGLTWDDLLRLDVEPADADTDSAEPTETSSAVGEPAEADGDVSAADKAEAIRLIDRLLARRTVSETLREDLTELKEAIAEGSFDAMDARYVRALAKRLGV